MRRVLLLTAAVAALAAPTAFAKEGAQAHLLARLPASPRPGSLVTVRWSVDVPGANGKRRPFGAIGMFVRLVSRSGFSTSAIARQYRPPYRVRIRVPAGGIARVRFGLEGTSCGPAGCKPSPAFFPLITGADTKATGENEGGSHRDQVDVLAARRRAGGHGTRPCLRPRRHARRVIGLTRRAVAAAAARPRARSRSSLPPRRRTASSCRAPRS